MAPAQDEDAGIAGQQEVVPMAAVQAYPVRVDALGFAIIFLIGGVLLIAAGRASRR
jgi:hypothetical protein